jgi:hypothetical protein
MNDDTAILPAGQLPDVRPHEARPDGEGWADGEARPDDKGRDSLAAELERAAPKRWWNRGTVVLAALVLLTGGFVGGVQVQKHWGTAPSPSGFPARFNAGAGAGRYGSGGAARGGAGTGPGAQGTGRGDAAASSGTSGTVKLVDGSTIYVQTQDGNVVTVNTGGKTTVSAASKSSLKSIKAGQHVTVQGTTGSDGTVTATSVTTRK